MVFKAAAILLFSIALIGCENKETKKLAEAQVVESTRKAELAAEQDAISQKQRQNDLDRFNALESLDLADWKKNAPELSEVIVLRLAEDSIAVTVFGTLDGFYFMGSYEENTYIPEVIGKVMDYMDVPATTRLKIAQLSSSNFVISDEYRSTKLTALWQDQGKVGDFRFSRISLIFNLAEN